MPGPFLAIFSDLTLSTKASHISISSDIQVTPVKDLETPIWQFSSDLYNE